MNGSGIGAVTLDRGIGNRVQIRIPAVCVLLRDQDLAQPSGLASLEFQWKKYRIMSHMKPDVLRNQLPEFRLPEKMSYSREA